MDTVRFHSPFYSFAALYYAPPRVEEIAAGNTMMLPDYEPMWGPDMGDSISLLSPSAGVSVQWLDLG